jgi:hypothetical protein
VKGKKELFWDWKRMMLNGKSGLRDQIELTKRTFGVDDT